MIWVFIVIGVVAVFAIAAGTIGSTVSRLADEPAREVYETDEIVEFVAEALPNHMTANLSYDDVERILRLHHDHLHEQGLARSGGDLDSGQGPLVVDDRGAIVYIIERAQLGGIRHEPAEVRAVLEAQLAYFEAIGAATEVEPPRDIELE